MVTPEFAKRWSRLCAESAEIARSKGWHEQPVVFPHFLALLHSEISEAFEDYRQGHDLKHVYLDDTKPCGIPIELADIVIRVADYCGRELPSMTEKEYGYNPLPKQNFPDFVMQLHGLVQTAHSLGRMGEPPAPSIMALVLTVFDFCSENGIELWSEIESKAAYNRSRPWRHGGKRL